MVVDPVARERAGAGELVDRPSVRKQRQRQARPRERRRELNERGAIHLAGCRDACPSSGGLGEPNPAVAGDRDWALVGERNRREGHALHAEPDRRRADLTTVDDPAAVDLDPRAQMVGEPKAIRLLERRQRIDVIRRRIVVVRQAHLERDLGDPLNSLGWNPRD